MSIFKICGCNYVDNKDKSHNGIYIHIPPFWEDKAMFDTLSEIYDDYPWIQPYRVFINKFGRTIPMMNKMVVSEMYVMKLKQTAHKGFSVRATGSISKKGVPEKSDNAKKNKTAFKDTPVKLGIDENLNLKRIHLKKDIHYIQVGILTCGLV